MSNPAVAQLRAREIMKRLPLGPCTVVELGCFIGVLAERLLLGRPDLKVVTVDSWADASEQSPAYLASEDFHARLTGDEQTRFRRMAEERLERFGDCVIILPMDSVKAAELIDDGSIDLVFIDADHSQEGVERDTVAWAPKVKPGGWLGWHDYAHPEPRFRFGVTEVVDAFCAAHGLELERGDNLTAFVRLRRVA